MLPFANLVRIHISTQLNFDDSDSGYMTTSASQSALFVVGDPDIRAIRTNNNDRDRLQIWPLRRCDDSHLMWWHSFPYSHLIVAYVPLKTSQPQCNIYRLSVELELEFLNHM
jgi:hypothetical protein